MLGICRPQASRLLLALLSLTCLRLSADTSEEVKEQNRERGLFYGNPFMEVYDNGSNRKRTVLPQAFDELFDTILPGQYKEGEWSLRLNPKLSDFIHDDYVRMNAGIRYSFSNYFDAYTDLGTWFGNPFKDGDGIGLYLWTLGTRYTWYNIADSNTDLAAGFIADFPIGKPPVDLSDGYTRYSPYFVVSHRFDKARNYLFYINTTYQIVADTPLRASSPYDKANDRLFLKPGAIYYPGGHIRYSLEVEYSTNMFDYSDDEYLPGEPPPYLQEEWYLAHREVHEVVVLPGITWFPNSSKDDRFILPGHWDLSVQLEVPVIEETGRDFGINLRLRWYFDYLKLIPGLHNGNHNDE